MKFVIIGNNENCNDNVITDTSNNKVEMRIVITGNNR